jgi:hypothetical protein
VKAARFSGRCAHLRGRLLPMYYRADRGREGGASGWRSERCWKSGGGGVHLAAGSVYVYDLLGNQSGEMFNLFSPSILNFRNAFI